MGGRGGPRVGRAVGRASPRAPGAGREGVAAPCCACSPGGGGGPPPILPPAEFCLQHSSLRTGDPSFPSLRVMVFMQGGC